ncbi:MAG: LytTR family transcriptional regulator DNA-binding domain-containing protein [Ruminococcus sp.]|nr:LytTR family transcriptional regulator DNA-binding domain-containing protein [Ruminococcus sp.]
MKLNIFKEPQLAETEVTVRYPKMSPKVENLIGTLQAYCSSVRAVKDGSTQTLMLDTIYYFESVDEKSYIYTESDVFDCRQKLYVIEKTLEDTSFIRISKSCIINISKLKSVKPFLNGRFEATMLNDEKVIINRHYVPAFKKKFGL